MSALFAKSKNYERGLVLCSFAQHCELLRSKNKRLLQNKANPLCFVRRHKG